MYNKKLLSTVLKDLEKAKRPAQEKDIDYNSKMGYRDDSPFRKKPKMDIYTEDGTIDMSNTGIDILANGRYLPKYSGRHKFDTNVVTEIALEQAKKGGAKSFSSNLQATNRIFKKNKLFKKNPLFKPNKLFKKKNYKSKTYDPMSMYFQDGGQLPEDYQAFLDYSTTAPENRRPNPDNPDDYDHYGMWDALGKPKTFEEALQMNPDWVPDEYDGYYHGFSVNPNTGVFLKSGKPGMKEGDTTWMEIAGHYLSPRANESTPVFDVDLQRFRYIPKEQYGGDIYAELTDDEIEEYRKGGYVVEEITDPSIPTLTRAQDGGQIYMYPGRKNTYYKKDSQGNWLIKSKDTGWKYKEITDPDGKRAKLLDANARPFQQKTTNTSSKGSATQAAPMPMGNALFDPNITARLDQERAQKKAQQQSTIDIPKALVSDNTRTVVPDFAAEAVMNRPRVDEAIKRQEDLQREFEAGKWKEYEKQSFLDQMGDRTQAFMVDPLGMASRFVSGEQAYIPGMGRGLLDRESPEYQNYLRSIGYTPGEFEISDVQNMLNPMYWGASIGNNMYKGNYGTAALEGVATVLPIMPKGSLSPSNIKAGVNLLADDVSRAGEYLTTQTPLKNAYRLNPAALKENPEMFLYRAEPTNFNTRNTVKTLQEKLANNEGTAVQQARWKNYINEYNQGHPRLVAQNDFHGQWLEKDPARLDWYLHSGDKVDVGTPMSIFRTKIPTSQTAQYNVGNIKKANVISSSPNTEFVMPRNIIEQGEKFPESSWQQLIQEDKAFNTPHWLRGYKSADTPKKIVSSSGATPVVNTTPVPWSMQEMPGLHLKSTMSDGAVSKIVEPKTGLVNVEQALGIIGKESGGANKVALIKQGLGETLPKKMDYNEFRKVVQDQLIPLERQFATDRSNYGIVSLGYPSAKRSSYEAALSNSDNYIADLNKQIQITSGPLKKHYGAGMNGETVYSYTDQYGTQYFPTEAEAIASQQRTLADLNESLNITIHNRAASLSSMQELPLENQTLILGNKNKFGRGSSAHGNPKETLGHIHFLRDAETPDVLTVTQIQSDAFQGPHRIMPKTQQEALEKLKLLEKEGEEIKMLYDDGTEFSNKVIDDHEKLRQLEEMTAKNFTQKQLLDKNHQERYLQELVSYAGERGDINKLRLPTSETAVKIQGYTKVGNVLDDPHELDRMYLEHENIFNTYGPKSEEMQNFNAYRLELMRNQNPKPKLDYSSEHKTILKKYSEQPKIVKKVFGVEPKVVTDSKGNTWYEFNIPEKFKTGAGEIKAFSTGGSIDMELTPEEIEVYKKRGYIIEDLDEFEDGGTVKKRKKKKQDTGINVETGQPAEISDAVEYRLPYENAPEGATEVLYQTYPVPVKEKAPDWAKFEKEYLNTKPIEDFLYDKKIQYLKRNKGLNQAYGQTLENFPSQVEQMFRDEYEYKMNNYITQRLGQKNKFKPSRRGEWVDELTDRERSIVANSKYESKLQPSVWSRTLSGLRSINNAIPIFSDNTEPIEGLTKKEDKEALTSWFTGVEALAPLEIPGTDIMNRVKNYNLSPNAQFKENPAIASGERRANVNDLDVMLPTLPLDIFGAAELIGNIPKGVKALKNFLKPAAATSEIIENIPASENVIETAFNSKSGKNVKTPASPDQILNKYDTYKDLGKKNSSLTQEEAEDFLANLPQENIDVIDEGKTWHARFPDAETTMSKQKEAFDFSTDVMERWAITDPDKYYKNKEIIRTAEKEKRKYKNNVFDKEHFDLHKKYAMEDGDYISSVVSSGSNQDEIYKTLDAYFKDKVSKDPDYARYQELEDVKNKTIKDLDESIENLKKESEDLIDPHFKWKVANVYKSAGVKQGDAANTLESIWKNRIKDRSKLVYMKEDDPAFKSLSPESQDELRKNWENIRGVRTKDDTITLASTPEKTYKLVYEPVGDTPSVKDFRLQEFKREVLNHPGQVGATQAHENAHDLQNFYGRWIDLLQEYNPEYGYYTGKDTNPIAKLFKEHMVEPKKVEAGSTKKWDYNTWLSGVGELHSELAKPRAAMVKYIMETENVSMENAIRMLKNTERAGYDPLYKTYLETHNLNKHFKPNTPFEIKKQLLKFLPATVPAAIGTGMMQQEKDGGSVYLEVSSDDIDKYVQGGYVVEEID